MQRRIRREQHGVLEHEARQRRMANANKHVHMATKFVNDEYMFHQECGSWDQECVHGCGYMHLSSSTAGTRKIGVCLYMNSMVVFYDSNYTKLYYVLL